MLPKRCLLMAAVGLMTASAAGCDPGYRYTPLDADGEKVPEWSTTIAGVRFSVDPYHTFIGSGNTLMVLDVANESKEVVEVLGGELETKGRTLKAYLPPGQENRAARTVPARSTNAVVLLVEFGEPASHVLGTTITWVWRVRIGNTEHTLRVSMDR
jgi:hypothetical protein